VKNFYTGGGEKFMGRGEKNSYVKTLKPFKKKNLHLSWLPPPWP
jgi:hypothetical protein